MTAVERFGLIIKGLVDGTRVVVEVGLVKEGGAFVLDEVIDAGTKRGNLDPAIAVPPKKDIEIFAEHPHCEPMRMRVPPLVSTTKIHMRQTKANLMTDKVYEQMVKAFCETFVGAEQIKQAFIGVGKAAEETSLTVDDIREAYKKVNLTYPLTLPNRVKAQKERSDGCT